MTGEVKGKPPQLDQALEKSVQELCLGWIENALLASAHDCSEGGLAVALAESAFSAPGTPLGATVDLESTLRVDALWFGESQSRIVVSYPAEREGELINNAEAAQVPFTPLGTVGGGRLVFQLNGETVMDEAISELHRLWTSSLGEYASRVG